MDDRDLTSLQHAVNALNQRNIEPFVQLMAPDMTWKGRRTRLQHWRHRPS